MDGLDERLKRPAESAHLTSMQSLQHIRPARLAGCDVGFPRANACGLQREPHPGLGFPKRHLGRLPLPPFGRFLQLAGDSRKKPREAVFGDEISGARLHRVDSSLFFDRPRDDDTGQIRGTDGENLQDLHCRQCGQREIADHEIPLPRAQRFTQRFGSVDAEMRHIVGAAGELAQHQGGIVFNIFDNQDAKRSHGSVRLRLNARS